MAGATSLWPVNDIHFGAANKEQIQQTLVPRALTQYRADKLIDSFEESLAISRSFQAVSPPTVSDLHGDRITGSFTNENSTVERIAAFVARWPPSRTPPEYCGWIAVDRGHDEDKALHTREQVLALEAAAETLKSSGEFTVENIDQIAALHGVRSGKWMIFTDTPRIDALWQKVVQLVCLERRRGYLKVSPNKEENTHVICVYVDDFTNEVEVLQLREDLRKIGVFWKLSFKLDAYTYLGLYSQNEWGIPVNRLRS